MASGSFLTGVFTPRQPKPEPGSVRVNGRRDAIIFRRIPIDSVVANPSSWNPTVLRQQVAQQFGPIATLMDVEMLVNPFKAGFSTPRDVNVLPTSAKGRYVTQDYGPGLTTIHMECQTGYILPFRNPPNVGVDAYTPVQPNGFPQVKTFDTQGYLRAPRSSTVGWTTLALSSERFNNFLSLYVVYNDFDASTEILIMTFGRAIFRGYMTNFTFELEAERAWNVRYAFDFVVQAGMDTWTRGIQGDANPAEYLHSVDAADDVPFPGGFNEAQLNDSPIVVGRTHWSVDGNGGQSVLDPGSFTSFTDTFTGLVPVSLG